MKKERYAVICIEGLDLVERFEYESHARNCATGRDESAIVVDLETGEVIAR